MLKSLSASIRWQSPAAVSQDKLHGSVESVLFSATVGINSISVSLGMVYRPLSGKSSGETLSFTLQNTPSLHLTDLIMLRDTSSVLMPHFSPKESPDFSSTALASQTGTFPTAANNRDAQSILFAQYLQCNR